MERSAPDDILRDARRLGPLPWSALGRGPAVPMPAAVAPWLARTLDQLWSELGRPDPLVVVDPGAADGSRAAEVLGLVPECGPALRWILVDDDPGAAAAQRRRLGGRPGPGEGRAHLGSAAPRALLLEDPALVLGPVLAGADPDEVPAPPPGIGPVLASLPDMPAGLVVAVVLAVGWLSRLPADRFEWRDGRWWEVRLAAGGAGALDEMLVDAGRRSPAPAGRAWRDGDRVRSLDEPRRWLAAARRVAEGGRVVAIDHPGGGGDRRPPGLDLDRLAAAPSAVGVLPPELSGYVAAQWPMLGG